MECPSCGYRTNLGDKDTNVKCPFCGAGLQQIKITSPQKLQSTQDTLELKRRYLETYGDEALYEISNTRWQIKQIWYLIFLVCLILASPVRDIDGLLGKNIRSLVWFRPKSKGQFLLLVLV